MRKSTMKLVAGLIVAILVVVVFVEWQRLGHLRNSTVRNLTFYKAEIESLNTQLLVISRHRKRQEELYNERLSDVVRQLGELKVKNSQFVAEAKKWKDEALQCRSAAPSTSADSAVAPPIESSATSPLPDNRDALIAQLQESKKQMETEILALKSELRNQSRVSAEHGTDAVAENIAREALDPLHPKEERKGYADGERVQFHRDAPGAADLEFRRGENDPGPKLPQILSQNALMKKLEDERLRKEKQQQGGQNVPAPGENPFEHAVRDNAGKVVDYQSLRKPKRDPDYKEMGD